MLATCVATPAMGRAQHRIGEIALGAIQGDGSFDELRVLLDRQIRIAQQLDAQRPLLLFELLELGLGHHQRNP